MKTAFFIYPMAVAALLAVPGPCQAEPKAPPVQVEAVFVNVPPTLDGKLGSPAWRLVAKSHKGIMAGWTTLGGGLAAANRIAYVCYDRDSLYIAVQCFTPDLYGLAEGSEASPWSGDDVEVHINAPSGYYQWGVDIDNHVAVGRCRKTAPAFVAAANADLEAHEASTPDPCDLAIRTATAYGSGQWDAEIAIPWKAVGLAAKPGTQIGFNLTAGHAYQGKDGSPPLTWGPSYWVENNESELVLGPQ